LSSPPTLSSVCHPATSERHHVVTTTTDRSEQNGWITGGEYREEMEGEAKQLEGMQMENYCFSYG